MRLNMKQLDFTFLVNEVQIPWTEGVWESILELMVHKLKSHGSQTQESLNSGQGTGKDLGHQELIRIECYSLEWAKSQAQGTDWSRGYSVEWEARFKKTKKTDGF